MKTLGFRWFFKCVILFLYLAFNFQFSYSQFLSVSFDEGYIGNIGNNPQDVNGILNFSTLGISYASFYQSDDDLDGQFDIISSAQGNDISGRLKFVFDDGTIVDEPAAVTWRVNNNADGFGILIRPYDDPAELIKSISYTSTKTFDLYSGKIKPTSSNVVLIVSGRGYSLDDGLSENGNAAINNVLTSLNTYLSNAVSSDVTPPTIPDQEYTYPENFNTSDVIATVLA